MQKPLLSIQGATQWSLSLVSVCKTKGKQLELTVTLQFVVKFQSDLFCFPSGSALDLNFSDINVASLDKELEDQDNSVGMAGKVTSYVSSTYSS